MKYTTVALLESPQTRDKGFGEYIEKHDIRVIPLQLDASLPSTLPAYSVDIVVAHMRPDEVESTQETAAACRIVGIPLLIAVTEGTTVERIHLLRMGADDALTPPYSLEEIVLRVQSLARRGLDSNTIPTHVWVLGTDELMIHEGKHLCRLNGKPLTLTEAQWDLLCFLSAHVEAAMTRHQLMERCLMYNNDIYDRAVDTHIKNLRAKLGNPSWIETVRGYGYRFSLQAREKLPRSVETACDRTR
jgi:DNA-binding response OmpR family regulator